MDTALNMDINAHTPQLSVIDGRSLPVREVVYCRSEVNQLAPETRVTSRHFDTMGRVVAQRDPRLQAPASRPNVRSIYSLPRQALLTDSVDAGWRVELLDESGRISEQWDGRGSHWHNEYDPQGRLIAIHEQMQGEQRRTIERLIYADNAVEFAERNQCSKLIRHDDRAGVVFYQNKALNGGLIRQLRRLLPDTSDVRSDWPLVEAQRDALLQPGAGYTSENRFGPLPEVLEQLDAAGHRQRFGVDRAGQLQSIDLTLKAGERQPIMKAAHYDAEGHLLTQVTGNDVTHRAAFEASTGRLIHLTTTNSQGCRQQDLEYEYDQVGNVIRCVDHTQSVTYFANQRVDADSTFTYDSLYQLVRATGRETMDAGQYPGLPELIVPAPIDPSRLLNYTEHYQYDAGGNRIGLRHVSDKNPFSQRLRVDAHSNRALPWSEDGDEPDFSREFDANGNLQHQAPGARSLVWDARNQLHSVTTVRRPAASDDSEGYRYNAAGQRVVKFSSQQAHALAHQRVVHYLPGLEVRTTDDDEELHIICITLARGSVRCLHWLKGQPADVEADTVRYSVADLLGSCSLELDRQGDVLTHEGYYPYGGTAWWAARSRVDGNDKTVRFSGKERDICGLYYFGARYYAPWLGRWICPDPAGAIDGLNLYRFCGNNPVSRIDRDGRTGGPISEDRIWGPADDRFVDHVIAVGDALRDALGLPPLADSDTLESEEEPMDEADSPVSSQADGSDSMDEDSPGSTGSSASPASPAIASPSPATEDQIEVVGMLNAQPVRLNYTLSSANLIQRFNFGAKVYRADRRPPQEVLATGFAESDDFTAIRAMINTRILIVAETLEGALYFAAQGIHDDEYDFYEIDATDVQGASLTENYLLNNERLLEHIGAAPGASPSSQTELAINMHEAHLSFNDLTRLNRSIVSLGKLPHEVARVRREDLARRTT